MNGALEGVEKMESIPHLIAAKAGLVMICCSVRFLSLSASGSKNSLGPLGPDLRRVACENRRAEARARYVSRSRIFNE